MDSFKSLRHMKLNKLFNERNLNSSAKEFIKRKLKDLARPNRYEEGEDSWFRFKKIELATPVSITLTNIRNTWTWVNLKDIMYQIKSNFADKGIHLADFTLYEVAFSILFDMDIESDIIHLKLNDYCTKQKLWAELDKLDQYPFEILTVREADIKLTVLPIKLSMNNAVHVFNVLQAEQPSVQVLSDKANEWKLTHKYSDPVMGFTMPGFNDIVIRHQSSSSFMDKLNTTYHELMHQAYHVGYNVTRIMYGGSQDAVFDEFAAHLSTDLSHRFTIPIGALYSSNKNVFAKPEYKWNTLSSKFRLNLQEGFKISDNLRSNLLHFKDKVLGEIRVTRSVSSYLDELHGLVNSKNI